MDGVGTTSVSSSGVAVELVGGAASSNESDENGSGAAAETSGVGRANSEPLRSIAARSGSEEFGESGVGDTPEIELKSFGGVESWFRSMSIVTSLDNPSGSSLDTKFVISNPSNAVGASIGSITVGVTAAAPGVNGASRSTLSDSSSAAGAIGSKCSESIGGDSSSNVSETSGSIDIVSATSGSIDVGSVTSGSIDINWSSNRESSTTPSMLVGSMSVGSNDAASISVDSTVAIGGGVVLAITGSAGAASTLGGVRGDGSSKSMKMRSDEERF
ncbi:MAG: hypothetical protein JF602_07915 [Gemmatimonadetes bacterium]|nr:hypothetical protein [Gemmatimonadota bacterium]